MKTKIILMLSIVILVTIFSTACVPENKLVNTDTTIQSTETSTTVDIFAPPSAEELVQDNFVMPDMPRILCEKLKQMMDNSETFSLVDARNSTNFKLGYIPGAVNIPNDDSSPIYTQEWVSSQLGLLPENEMIIFYCD